MITGPPPKFHELRDNLADDADRACRADRTCSSRSAGPTPGSPHVTAWPRRHYQHHLSWIAGGCPTTSTPTDHGHRGVAVVQCQPDPTGQDAHYTYAGNSPVSFTDVTGASFASVFSAQLRPPRSGRQRASQWPPPLASWRLLRSVRSLAAVSGGQLPPTSEVTSRAWGTLPPAA